MKYGFNDRFDKFLDERAQESGMTAREYVMQILSTLWIKQGYSPDNFTMPKKAKNKAVCKTYEKEGIIYTDKYDYEFCKKVMDMYHDGGSTRSIAKYLGKHQKTIWRIVDRNLNKGDE